MQYIKMLGLAAVAAAALMAIVGASTAPAAQLTSPAGTLLNVGTVIKAETEGHLTLHMPIGSLTCGKSTIEGTISNAGGKTNAEGKEITDTVKGAVSKLTFTECNSTMNVLKTGTLEIHSLGNGNGTLTSTGAEVTMTYLGINCIFTTNNTDLGTVTGSGVTKSNATLDIATTIPRTGHSAFCGSTSQWTGAYKFTSPNPLVID